MISHIFSIYQMLNYSCFVLNCDTIFTIVNYLCNNRNCFSPDQCRSSPLSPTISVFLYQSNIRRFLSCLQRSERHLLNHTNINAHTHTRAHTYPHKKYTSRTCTSCRTLSTFTQTLRTVKHMWSVSFEAIADEKETKQTKKKKTVKQQIYSNACFIHLLK